MKLSYRQPWRSDGWLLAAAPGWSAWVCMFGNDSRHHNEIGMAAQLCIARNAVQESPITPLPKSESHPSKLS